MRGEFIRGDGLVLPNNVTPTGAARLLDMAFRTDSYPDFNFVVGLCNAVFRPEMTFADLEIPTGGGYDAALLPRRAGYWTLHLDPAEPYIESIDFSYPATGDYSIPITRMYLGEQNVTHVFALSSPLPTPLKITPTTPPQDRTFRYRLYLR